MAACVKSASSSASRMARTRPSIMSLGQTASAPASAWLTATRVSSSSVASFAISPSSTTPQWPCVVYAQRHTSVSSSSSGKRGRSARRASCTTPSSDQAPDASSSFSSGTPNSSSAGTPARARRLRFAQQTVDGVTAERGQLLVHERFRERRTRASRGRARPAASRGRAHEARASGVAAADGWRGSSHRKTTRLRRASRWT